MSKPQFRSNQQTSQVFEDLDRYRNFCVEYGWVFDESHLYNNRANPWKQFVRYTENRSVRNNWIEDSKAD